MKKHTKKEIEGVIIRRCSCKPQANPILKFLMANLIQTITLKTQSTIHSPFIRLFLAIPTAIYYFSTSKTNINNLFSRKVLILRDQGHTREEMGMVVDRAT